MEFIKWSKLSPQAKLTLVPNLGIKSWDDLDIKKRELILTHFHNKGWLVADDSTYKAIYEFDSDHKANAYCNHLLGHGGPHFYNIRGVSAGRNPCCDKYAMSDAYNIFLRRNQDVVYEVISYYAQVLKKTTHNNQYSNFMNFFNDISDQFGLNIMLLNNGLVLRQETKINKEIYEPVLNYLSDKKWEPVSRDLGDAFTDYMKNTPEGYSSCITHAVSALQAFLQISVNGVVGKGEIAALLKAALNKKLIPTDPFSEKVFKDIVSVLMIERQSKGDPHPKEEYANEKSARLVLNLIMVFLQHSIQN